MLIIHPLPPDSVEIPGSTYENPDLVREDNVSESYGDFGDTAVNTYAAMVVSGGTASVAEVVTQISPNKLHATPTKSELAAQQKQAGWKSASNSKVVKTSTSRLAGSKFLAQDE